MACIDNVEFTAKNLTSNVGVLPLLNYTEKHAWYVSQWYDIHRYTRKHIHEFLRAVKRPGVGYRLDLCQILHVSTVVKGNGQSDHI